MSIYTNKNIRFKKYLLTFIAKVKMLKLEYIFYIFKIYNVIATLTNFILI